MSSADSAVPPPHGNDDSQAALIHQRKVLADFGDFALQSEDLDAVLTEACRLVAEAMRTGRAKVLEIEEGGESLLLRAGVGWAPDVVGQVRIPMAETSSESFSIRAGVPVITQDISKDSRFQVPDFMKKAGVVALANVPIFLPGRQAYGLLQVDDTKPRDFDGDDTEFLRTYATILGPVIDRLLKLQALQASEERFRLTVEAATDYAIFVTDADDRITDWLPGAAAVFGWSAEEAQGQPAAILFTPEDREAGVPEEEVGTAHREGYAPNVRWHLRKDGSRVFIDGSVRALHDGQGQPVGFIKIGQDVTARHEAEEALRQSGERQAFLLKLSDRLRGEPDADAIVNRAIAMLRDQLVLDRCYVASFHMDEDRADITHQVGSDRVAPMPPAIRLSDFPAALRINVEGTLVIEDVAGAPDLSEIDRRSIEALGFGALVAATLRRGADNPLWTIVAVSASPRRWTPGEVALAEEVAERTWAAVERAKAEERLRASEARLQNVLRIQTVGVIFWGEGFRLTDLNDAFLRLTGLTRDEALGKTWADLTPPEFHGVSRLAIAQVETTGESTPFEKQYYRKDGSRWWGLFAARRVGHEIVEFVLDVTERREAEDALRESEHRFRTLAEGMPQLVWRAGDHGLWSWASPQWCGFTGQEENESHGWGWLDALHPEDREAARAAWERSKTSGSFEADYRLRHAATGEHRWFQTRAAPVWDQAGRVVEWLGTSTDVQDLREMQERQGVLVAELQHRTRNLLGVVRAMADKTLKGSGSLADFGARFQSRLAALGRVNGLLSRLDEGSRITFDQLIRTELAAHGATDAEGHGPQVHLDGLAGVRLRSSTVQTLALALHELATNAVKHGALSRPEGRLAVTWEVVREAGEPRLRVDWRESAVPIPAGQRPVEATDAAAASGPALSPIRPRGYGRELIERALPYQLGAGISYELTSDGVRCTITLPLSSAPEEARPLDGGLHA